jgi:hypothetical protein
MSSRSGSRSRRQRSGEPREDFPALPVPRLPSLRSLAAQRERDSTSPATSGRPLIRNWASAAARRAERLQNLEAQNMEDNSEVGEFQRALEHAWGPPAYPLTDNQQRRARASNLDELDRSLDEANTHIRALLDVTSPYSSLTPILSHADNSFPRAPDYTEDQRRSKRRKLDSDKRTSSSKPFRYGKYGQVEPGQLRMEIVSCDGGMFSNESSYAAENILKNDNTVYCTKGNRCNIVLRHQDGTHFTLQQLVIKGPTSMNYSHP